MKRHAHSRTVLWRRIDVEGMDACSFGQRGEEYVISGTALYQDHGATANLSYRVSCNPDWSTRSARVSGWCGTSKKEFSVTQDTTNTWTMDGQTIDGVKGLLDIDLGFTPATNTNAIKRLNLAIGAQAETTAAWLDTDDWRLKPLTQVYRRLSETEYVYSSPAHDYTANLTTDAFGIIRLYPKLWSAVS